MDFRRFSDLLLAICVLPLVLPLCVLVALLVRVCLGSPVLFRQERAGMHGRLFRLVKFRTMRVPAPGEPMLASDAQRMTALGRVLRKSGLDELPCLYNILRGELAWVGPRPLLPEYLPLYNQRQAMRHQVRPGLTGWAQVNGRNALSWADRLELDAWYVEHRGFLLDLRILLYTVKVVLRGIGSTPAGRDTSEPFRGNL